MAKPPIGIKQLITAEQFNELASQFATYWADDNPQLKYSELTSANKSLHTHGWGQNSVVLWDPSESQQKIELVKTETGLLGIRIGDIILADHTNTVIAQINAGVLHTDVNGECTYLSPYAVGSKIYASSYFLISSFIETFETTRFDLNPLYAEYMMDPDAEAVTVVNDDETQIWSLQSMATVAAHFNTYNEMRYFFNSGGSVCFDLQGIGFNPRGEQWARVFNIIGEICVGAVETTNSGPQKPLLSSGVFDALPGQRQLVFKSTVDRAGGLGEYGYGEYGYSEYGENGFQNNYSGDYSGYGASEYDSATISIYVEIHEHTDGSISVEFDIVLTEDPNIINQVDLEITMTAGYKQPIDAPSDDYLIAGHSSRYTVDGTNYQFQERVPPSLEVVENWTIIN